MPKYNMHHWEDEMDEGSEQFNPAKADIESDFDTEQKIKQEIYDIESELKRTYIRAPHIAYDAESAFMYDDEPMVHPEHILDRVHLVLEDITKIHDTEIREKCRKQMVGIEERVIDHFTPYIQEKVQNAGYALFYFAERARDPKRKGMDSSQSIISRTTRQIRDAIQMIEYWNIDSDRKIELCAVLTLEESRFKQYIAEPFLWGFEDIEMQCIHEIHREVREMMMDRFDTKPKLGKEEDFLRIPEHIETRVKKLEILLQGIGERDPEILISCTNRLQNILQDIEYIRTKKQEFLRPKVGKSAWDYAGGTIEWAMSILECDAHESLSNITKIYRGLAKKYHPDTVSIEERDAANDKMKKINHAYTLLRKQKELEVRT